VFPIRVTVEEYVAAGIVPENDSYVFDTTTIQRTIDIPVEEGPFSTHTFFDTHNFSINFVTLLEFSMKFSLKTIRFRDLGPLKSPDCFSFEIVVSIDRIIVKWSFWPLN